MFGKKNGRPARMPHWIWMVISLAVALLLWTLISCSEKGGIIFATPWVVAEQLAKKLTDGSLLPHILISLFRVFSGFSLGFLLAQPIAFLMGWYTPLRLLMEPWAEFVRCIPPLAYIPIVIVGAGVGESAKIIVIFIATFLVVLVTVYQGVRTVDPTLVKAARVLGTNDRGIFFRVVIPASTPFIFTAARLGVSASLTTLVAAELTGTSQGLGMMIQKASGYYDMATVLLGILIIGVIGLSLDKLVRFLERRLTSWQETMPLS